MGRAVQRRMLPLSPERFEGEQRRLQQLLLRHVDDGSTALATAHGDLFAQSLMSTTAFVVVVVGRGVVGFVEVVSVHATNEHTAKAAAVSQGENDRVIE